MNEHNVLARALERYGVGEGEDRTRDRIIDAALRQFELFGINRSTVEDITRRSRLARVTLYRRFPSKQQLIDAVIQRELGRFLTDLERDADQYPGIEDKLTEGFLFTLHALRTHPLLNRLLESEPDTLLPYLTVQGSTFLRTCSEFLATQLAQALDDDRPGTELLTVSELTVRIIMSFVLTPTAVVDLDEPATARDFARRYLQPLLTGTTAPEPKDPRP